LAGQRAVLVIAMVFQSYALYPTMSVADNIGFALEIRKMPNAAICGWGCCTCC
jgi:ABC-type sugar transport system ATPase subunit